jgi:crossover junction endodeoxyribonuclease RuvC
MTVYIGIDPGANGGMATIEPPDTVYAFPFKKISMKLISSMLEDLAGRRECHALIEVVHAMPGQGVTSMFNFGYNFGVLEGLLIGSGIPYDRVTPQAWQKEFDLYKLPGETKTAKKNRHKELAQQMFPDLKVTHATADALLIAEYCRRQHV